MRNHVTLTAAVAATAALLVAPAARATVDPEDQGAPFITVKVKDKATDVRVEKGLRKAAARAARAAEVLRVQYDLDRSSGVGATLTITTELARRVLAEDKPYRQYFVTAAVNPEDGSEAVVSTSSRSLETVRVLTPGAEEPVACDSGTVSVTGGTVLTQVVPLSCLGDMTNGRLRSSVGVERLKGADLGSDAAPWTRDLPLTALP